MSQFVYRTRDNRGVTDNGVLAASDLSEASDILRSAGNIIIDLREQAADDETAGPSRLKKKSAKPDEVILFANQLAVMVDTGVPLPEALDCIAEQVSKDGFAPVVADLADSVKAGVDFSSALARYPKIFGQLFIAMMRASEISGTMGKMLQRVASYLQRQRQIRKQVKGAAAYPIAMLCFCVLVVIGMLLFILPRFERIYAGKSAVLPMPTRALLAISAAILGYWPFIVGGLVIVAAGGYLYFRRPEGKITLDRFRIQAPVLGGMFRRSALAKSLRTLSTMIASGVSMLDALEITADVSGNTFYSRIWRDVGQKLKEGATLSEEIKKHPLIPGSVIHMIAAGERTGKLDTVMDRLAGFCEQDLEATIKTATSFIEPILIVVMGAIVGGVALALLLPIFSLSKVVAS